MTNRNLTEWQVTDQLLAKDFTQLVDGNPFPVQLPPFSSNKPQEVSILSAYFRNSLNKLIKNRKHWEDTKFFLKREEKKKLKIKRTLENVENKVSKGIKPQTNNKILTSYQQIWSQNINLKSNSKTKIREVILILCICWVIKLLTIRNELQVFWISHF